MKRSREEILKALRANGYAASEFSIVTEGRYSVDDASWNYRDGIVHLEYVHPQVKNIPIVADDEKLASIFLQRVFGIRFPIGVVDYETKRYEQTTFFAWGFFVVVVQNLCTPLGPNQSRVTTLYLICSPPFFKWLHPVLKWILKRNYRLLMSQDIPMRERRGELRDWGFSFRGDTHSYERANEVATDKVEFPVSGEVPAPRIFDVANLREGQRLFYGRSDQFGLQLVREGTMLLVFKRLCPHQGASLDTGKFVDGKIGCGWHGRKFAPLAQINLDGGDRTLELDGYRYELGAGKLKVSHFAPIAERVTPSPRPSTCGACDEPASRH